MMGTTFKPRSVEPRQALVWLREGLALTTRQLAANVLLMLVYFGLASLLPFGMRFLSGFIAGIWLVLLSLVAEAADHHRPLWRRATWRGTALPARNAMLTLLAAAALYLTLVMAVNAGIDLIEHFARSGQAVAVSKAAPPHRTPVAQALVFMGMGTMHLQLAMMLYRLLLATPLMVFHGLPWQEARQLSREATHKNYGAVVGVTLALFLATLFGLDIYDGIAVMALFPLTAASLYAAYRDIFLGISENQPKPATERRLAVNAG